MEIQGLLRFLSPIGFSQSGGLEFLPLIFFIVIWLVFLITYICVEKNATPGNWEKKWHGDSDEINLSSGFDVSGGSILEISHVVATRSERVSDIMPGMILIIGLLGTFLSLGLALDKASYLLSNADANNMGDSISKLMGMLEGLGTKFKTSTWGIMAFILLKSTLAGMGFEDRRLRWCVRKVKEELDNIRKNKEDEENRKNEKFINGINSVVSKLIEQNHEIIGAINIGHKESIGVLRESADQSRETCNAMDRFVNANLKTVETLGSSAAGMLDAAKTMGDGALKLQNVIEKFRSNMESVIVMMKDELGGTIEDMNTCFSENMGEMSENMGKNIGDMSIRFKSNMSEMSQGLKSATNDISAAVTSLSSNVKVTMDKVGETINESMGIQTKVMQSFDQTSEHLQEEILEMTALVGKLKDDIKDGLAAVSASNRSVIALDARYKSIGEQVEKVILEFKVVNEGLLKLGNLDHVMSRFVMTTESQKDILQQIASNTTRDPRGQGMQPRYGGRK